MDARASSTLQALLLLTALATPSAGLAILTRRPMCNRILLGHHQRVGPPTLGLLDEYSAGAQQAGSPYSALKRHTAFTLDMSVFALGGAFGANLLLVALPALASYGRLPVFGAVLLPAARFGIRLLSASKTASAGADSKRGTEACALPHSSLTLQGLAMHLERQYIEMKLEVKERREIADQREEGLDAAREALQSACRWVRSLEVEAGERGDTAPPAPLAPAQRQAAVAMVQAAAMETQPAPPQDDRSRERAVLRTHLDAARSELLVAAERVEWIQAMMKQDTLCLLGMQALLAGARVRAIESRVQARASRPGFFPTPPRPSHALFGAAQLAIPASPASPAPPHPALAPDQAAGAIEAAAHHGGSYAARVTDALAMVHGAAE